MKRRLKKLLVMFMVLMISINTFGIHVIATEASEQEVSSSEEVTEQIVEEVFTEETTEQISEEISTEETTESALEEEITEKNFEGDGFQVTFFLVDSWDTGFNATVKIYNTSETVIENWCLQYVLNNTITNIWNAEILGQEENIYTIKNVGWNQDIAVGESIEFGISSNESFQGFPEEYNLLGGNEQMNEEDYTVEYNWDNDWQTGFQGTFSITNNTESVIEDWTIEFDFENEITDIWDAEIASHEGDHYIIHNAGYNKDINANETVTFGIVVNEGDSAKAVSNIVITKYIMDDVSQPEREPEPLEDIGEAYFKEPTEDDVVINEETGIMYIKNQVLVSALPGAPKEAFEDIAEYIGAEIVGYIELTNDYQFEFKEDKTAEELDNMIAYLSSFSFVSFVSLNLYEANCTEITRTNDYLYRDNVTYIEKDNKLESIPMEKEYSNGWNEDIPDGDNWGLEALKILSAWDSKAKFKPVKVGVYDNSFARHTDVRYDYVFNGTLNDISKHGTRVAGVLAAQMNNNKGISGIVTDADLYAYATEGTGSSMGSKHAYMTLIANHVKVINVSMGEENFMQYAASHGNEKAQNHITQGAEVLGEFLEKLIKQGYDFVIVTSAGNAENVPIVIDDSLDYGCRDLVDGENTENLNLASGGINPFFNCPLTAITRTSVKDRIIVVAAVDYYLTSSGVGYYYASYSNRGERVDVCAPGEKILSTVPYSVSSIGYNLGGGTSIASPHIAGVAGLMYQMNPSIRGTQVKEIICDNCFEDKDNGGNVIKLPNAELCVDKAEQVYEFSENDNPLPTGVLTGKIVDQEGVPIKGVKVTANRTSVDESNVESYYNTGVTDQDGFFEVILPEGLYDLNIHTEGYLPYTVKDITIQTDETEFVGELVLAIWVPESLFSESAGVVIDALDGMRVSDAVIRLRKGWNNYNGDYVYDVAGNLRKTITNSKGEFLFSLPAGIYTAEVVKDGYITGYYNVVATIVSLANKQTLALTPLLSENEYRIILTWGEEPRDLDSHLTYYVNDEKKMHVSYQNKTGKYNGEVIAKLNLDDVTSYGPETVTLTLNAELLENEVFKYSVHNFTGRSTINSKDLANSNAVIRVYKGNALIDKIHVPQDEIGNVWHVFDIDKDGIILYNEFYDATSASKVQ